MKVILFFCSLVPLTVILKVPNITVVKCINLSGFHTLTKLFLNILCQRLPELQNFFTAQPEKRPNINQCIIFLKLQTISETLSTLLEHLLFSVHNCLPFPSSCAVVAFPITIFEHSVQPFHGPVDRRFTQFSFSNFSPGLCLPFCIHRTRQENPCFPHQISVVHPPVAKFFQYISLGVTELALRSFSPTSLPPFPLDRFLRSPDSTNKTLTLLPIQSSNLMPTSFQDHLSTMNCKKI